MRFRSYICAALTVVASTACLIGCSDDKAKEVKESAQDLAERGKQLGSDAVEQGKKGLNKGKEIARSLLDKGKRWGELSLREMQEFGDQIVDEYGDDINAAGEHVNGLLSKIARDPRDEFSPGEKIARMIILMVPLIGPTKRYADARRMYEFGRKEDDQLKIQVARRECLLAFGEAGLDIGTLGLVGSRLDLVASGADRVLKLLKITRNVNALLGDDFKTFDGLLDKLLEIDDVRQGVENALQADFSSIATM